MLAHDPLGIPPAGKRRTEAKIEENQNAGDVLVDMGWILIHNPNNMLIKVTRNESKTITKSQKEFLYDFYLKHGDTEKANELYK